VNLIFRFLLTINATSWMLVIYAIKENWTLCNISARTFGMLLLLVPVLLSLISIWTACHLGSDSLSGCEEFTLADNEFLPVYLGYFFLSVGIEENTTMLFLYIIVFVFTFLSQTQYFNPIFLLFGYHYYHILTPHGTRVFVIAKGKVVRNQKDISFSNLKRINDTTYIDIYSKKRRRMR